MALVYHLVARRFGAPAGLIAALFLSLTPVTVAIDRSSNIDSCLLLVLLLAAWALLRAAEAGDRRFLLLSMALIGLAFNVKMLAGFVLLPAFALVYLAGTPFAWRRRLVDAVAAGLVLGVVSTAWILVYDLTPAARRPYAGTSGTNSVAEIAVGPYGVGRFVRQVRPAAVGGLDATRRELAAAATETPAAERPAAARAWTAFLRQLVRAPVGPLRLASGQLAAQFAWLLPLAIVGVVFGMRRAPLGMPLAPAHLTLLLWVTWALV